MGKQRVSFSDFYCLKCKRKGIPLTRKMSKQREKGHLKKLWCCYCQEETNHCEIKSNGSYTYENFLVEIQDGNFDEQGNRIVKCSI